MKRNINILEFINKIVKPATVTKSHLKIHDLSVLWNYIKELSSIDNRIQSVIDSLNDYIVDYYDVDLTGEVFRYPFDINNKHHLDDFWVINILKFKERFDAMTSIIEPFEIMLDYIRNEYQMHTFLPGYSRKDIENISKELPQKCDWGTDSFTAISTEIKTKYKIPSQKCYSKILDIIKGHREFSMNIGINIPVKELTLNDYQIYRDEYLSLCKKLPKESIVAFNFRQVELQSACLY
jgi:hypothetical protein